jgi:hypothetical protein
MKFPTPKLSLSKNDRLGSGGKGLCTFERIVNSAV